MDKKFQIIHIEDNENDALLIQEFIRTELISAEFNVVESEAQLNEALQ